MSVKRTNEFSLCLEPARETIDAVQAIRDQLPPSPYRDDPPHATLVRGIVSSETLSDAELVNRVVEATRIDEKLPFSAAITEVANKSNRFYSESSGLVLQPSDELQLFRQEVLKSLGLHGFSDESYDQNTFPLHIAIRLGVKLEGELLEQAKQQFLNKSVGFSAWFLFRLELEDDARKMHEVRP